MPQCKGPHQPASNIRLTAANGTTIPVYGQQHLKINIAGRTYSWNFIVADITLPLLGADFLANYQLLVDVDWCRLMDAASLTATPISAAPINLSLQVDNAANSFSHLHNSYPDAFKPELRQHPQQPAKHGIYHRIKTTGLPVFSKFRRLAPDKLVVALRHLPKGLESLGITSTHCNQEGWYPATLR